MLQDFSDKKENHRKGRARGLRIQALILLLVFLLTGCSKRAQLGGEGAILQGWGALYAKGGRLKFHFVYLKGKALSLALAGKCILQLQGRRVLLYDAEKGLCWEGETGELSGLFKVVNLALFNRMWEGENVLELEGWKLRVSRRFPSGQPKVVSIVGPEGGFLLRLSRVEKTSGWIKIKSCKKAALEEVCSKYTRPQR